MLASRYLLLLLIYFNNRRWNARFTHVVEIILGVEAIIAGLIYCWDTLERLTCNTDFERTLLMIGLLASGWIVVFGLRKILSSKPH